MAYKLIEMLCLHQIYFIGLGYSFSHFFLLFVVISIIHFVFIYYLFPYRQIDFKIPLLFLAGCIARCCFMIPTF